MIYSSFRPRRALGELDDPHRHIIVSEYPPVAEPFGQVQLGVRHQSLR